jgi:hypothetical protein
MVFDVLAKSLLEFLSQVEDVRVDEMRLVLAVVSAVLVDVGLEQDQSQCECYRVAAGRQK